MVILFTGKAGAGKDTAAYIVKEFLPDSGLCAFAKKLKNIAKQSFGWDEEKDKKGRKLLQSIGQAGRAYNKDIWAEDGVRQIKKQVQLGRVAIITDLRFRNELDIVKKAYPKAKVVLIKGRRADLEENEKDISEHDLDGFNSFNYVLNNNGSKDELRTAVKDMLQQFGLLK